MNDGFRCSCPITSALDIVGDKWTLVLIKQMLLEGRSTFKEFREAEEAIATNVLASRLKRLEGYGLVRKGQLPDNRKVNHYRLTEKGLGFAPVVMELALWSEGHLGDIHPGLVTGEPLQQMKANRDRFLQALKQAYRERHAPRTPD